MLYTSFQNIPVHVQDLKSETFHQYVSLSVVYMPVLHPAFQSLTLQTTDIVCSSVLLWIIAVYSCKPTSNYSCMCLSSHKRNFCWYVSLLQRHKTSVIPWKSIRMLPKRDPMLKRVSPPHCHLMQVRHGDTHDVVHDLRDEVALLEETLSQMGASTKCPSNLCNVADHHLNDLYQLSIVKVAQHKKIRCTIVSKLEWL